MLNNPVVYNDPTGHSVDNCPPGDTACEDMQYDEEDLPSYENISESSEIIIPTNAIVLDGGPGAVPYYQAAEDNWNGYLYSGATGTPFDAVWNTPDVANFGLVFLRDNTDFRASYSVREVCGSIYATTEGDSMQLTGVSISNTSYEDIFISRVEVYTFWSHDAKDTLIGTDVWKPNICGNTTSLAISSQRLSDNQYYANVYISVFSESYRWGILTGTTK
jgi:hypothetical protein